MSAEITHLAAPVTPGGSSCLGSPSSASLRMTEDDGEGGRQLSAPWLQFHNSRHLWARTASFLNPQENTQEHFPNCLGVIVAASLGQQKLSAPLQLLLSTVWAKSSAQEQAHLSSSTLMQATLSS